MSKGKSRVGRLGLHPRQPGGFEVKVAIGSK